MIYKFFIILLFSFSLSSSRYEQAMERGINMLEKSETREDYIKCSNFFYRIHQAQKDNWLPSYYYSLSNVRLSLIEKESFIKDEYLDKALKIVSLYDSVFLDIDSLAVSEILTLKGMIFSSKIMIDPMTRGREFGSQESNVIEDAILYAKYNPRPYLISGQMKFYTPAAFGGGMEKAMPLLESAVNFYNIFKIEKYWPNWGEDLAIKMYEQAKKTLQNSN